MKYKRKAVGTLKAEVRKEAETQLLLVRIWKPESAFDSENISISISEIETTAGIYAHQFVIYKIIKVKQLYDVKSR